MKAFFTLACSSRIAQSALRVSIVVGTILNLINQGEAILQGSDIDIFHFLLNYLVPYCVASYSAIKNEITRNHNAE